MAARYFVDLREIKDAAKMADRRARISAVVEPFGVRCVVIGGPLHVLEGSHQPVSQHDPVPHAPRGPALLGLRGVSRTQSMAAIPYHFECIADGRHSGKSLILLRQAMFTSRLTHPTRS